MHCCDAEGLGSLPTGWTRRTFLTGMAAGAVVLAARSAWAGRLVTSALEDGAPRQLTFFHTHTSESLQVVYWRDGTYDPAALEAVSRFLRDFRTGDAVEMDPALLDILHVLRSTTRTQAPFQVISAYRSPRTNAMLRERSRGVARDSQHLRGRAIDIRLADVDTAALRDAALALGRGGVGYYRGEDFVHVDTGRVRCW